MSFFSEWAHKLFAKPAAVPTIEELEQAVDEATILLPLWEGKAGELTKRLVRQRETELLEDLISEQRTHEQYTHGRGRIAGYREALGVIENTLRKGAAAQLELERRAAARAGGVARR